MTGMEPENLPRVAQIHSYLRRAGWKMQSLGSAGVMYNFNEALGVVVPREDGDDAHIARVIFYVANWERRPESAVIADMWKEDT